ncbi:hypothetical protein EF847_17360 [Actinobacteria bacterium YIM 96077]|nr:hypothetical protein EF847_17360 [Actinobacteria bacterium YIM 96077]
MPGWGMAGEGVLGLVGVPAAVVFEAVVVPAQGDEVGCDGRPAGGVIDGVVLVGAGGGHAAGRVRAVAVADLDQTAHPCCGSAAAHIVVGGGARAGGAPAGGARAGCVLFQDVGHDGMPARVMRVRGGERVQVGVCDVKFDDAPAGGMLSCRAALPGRAGSPGGDAVVDGLAALVADDPAPFGCEQGGDRLSGQGRGDVSPSGKFGRVIVEFKQGAQLDT